MDKNSLEIRIADIVEDSIVDGPGLRMTVFVQGCYRHCPGCHNPQTWDTHGGRLVPVGEIVQQLREARCMNLSISGGEPLLQARALLPLVVEAHDMMRTVWMWTGFSIRDFADTRQGDCWHWQRRLLREVDAVIDGAYVQELRDPELLWRGSSNQKFWTRREVREVVRDVMPRLTEA